MKLATQSGLSPEPCDVYEKQSLVYLFYGRPAYKPLQRVGPTTSQEFYPACFVFDPAILRRAKRIMPFDSGGFPHYKSLVGPVLELKEFELGKAPDMPRRVVKAFFDNSRNYYEQLPQKQEGAFNLSQRLDQQSAHIGSPEYFVLADVVL